MPEAVAVLDVGKTHAKLSLVGRVGGLVASRTRANATPVVDGRAVLDADGIETWALATLADLARTAKIVAIVPVAHGAAAALVDRDHLLAPVMDYEVEPPAAVARAYDLERDPFALTGSPRLPAGLNLGLQLFWQEILYPDLWPRAQALLWPQYWAWRLCGERAAETTSLGCHSDLWRPYAQDYSPLAKSRGWDVRLGARRGAGDVIGAVKVDLARRLGLGEGVGVCCGLHDSNAALAAVRAFPELKGSAFALISTGTWFVTFQSGAAGERTLNPARDTLVNVDIEGRPVPSARFMGGREYAAIAGSDLQSRPAIEAAASLVMRGVRTRPSFADGGPFPNVPGAVVGKPATAIERASLASLHVALMSHVELDLVGAEGPIIIEGRFAEDPVFPRVLAALRPSAAIYVCPDGGDAVALGAARLVWPDLRPRRPLSRVEPLPFDLAGYAEAWQESADPIPTRA